MTQPGALVFRAVLIEPVTGGETVPGKAMAFVRLRNLGAPIGTIGSRGGTQPS